MAKKTKGLKTKMPKVTKLSQEQMDNFLTAIMNSNIGAENAEFAKMPFPSSLQQYRAAVSPGCLAVDGSLHAPSVHDS